MRAPKIGRAWRSFDQPSAPATTALALLPRVRRVAIGIPESRRYARPVKKQRFCKAVRTAKWTGTILVALIIIATLISTRVRCSVVWGRFNFCLWPGAFQVLLWSPGAQDAKFDFSYVVPPYLSAPSWKFIIDRNPGGNQYWGFYAPFWFWLALAGLPTALLWWSDRSRFRAGHCSACGYNLSALPQGTPCPECGIARTSEP